MVTSLLVGAHHERLYATSEPQTTAEKCLGMRGPKYLTAVDPAVLIRRLSASHCLTV